MSKIKESSSTVQKVHFANHPFSADWTQPIDNTIDMPDHLIPLYNKIGNQLMFHKISGKEEKLTVLHMVRIAEEFFLNPDKAIVRREASNVT